MELSLTPLDGEIGYKQHTEGHVTWPTFIEFASRSFEKSEKESYSVRGV